MMSADSRLGRLVFIVVVGAILQSSCESRCLNRYINDPGAKATAVDAQTGQPINEAYIMFVMHLAPAEYSNILYVLYTGGHNGTGNLYPSKNIIYYTVTDKEGVFFVPPRKIDTERVYNPTSRTIIVFKPGYYAKSEVASTSRVLLSPEDNKYNPCGELDLLKEFTAKPNRNQEAYTKAEQAIKNISERAANHPCAQARRKVKQKVKQRKDYFNQLGDITKEDPARQKEILEFRDNVGAPLIYSFAKAGKAKQVEGLIAIGAEVNDRSGRFNPLNVACLYCSYETVKVLVINGAEINTQDSFGRTPLLCVMQTQCPYQRENRKLIFEYLTENGADPNIICKQGETALIRAVLNYQDNLKEVHQLPSEIAKQKAQIGYDESMIKSLLSHGADPNIKDNSGKTALDYAAESPIKKIIQSKSSLP